MEIKGMEILKTTEVTESYFSPFIIVAAVMLALVFVMFMGKGVVKSYDAEKLCNIIIVIFLSLSLTFIALTVIDTNIWHKDEKHVTRNEYEVRFSGPVNLEEVRAHYEIVEQKGDIYILRDHLPVVTTCVSCDNVLEKDIHYCPSCGAEVVSGATE